MTSTLTSRYALWGSQATGHSLKMAPMLPTFSLEHQPSTTSLTKTSCDFEQTRNVAEIEQKPVRKIDEAPLLLLADRIPF